MTREEAIKKLEHYKYCLKFQYGWYSKDDDEALDMAIRALKNEKTDGDLISRTDLLKELEKWDWQDAYLPTHFAELVADLPSAEQTAEWIEVIDEIDSLGNKTWHHECSICGNRDSGWGDYKYCPNCGAIMKGVKK